MSEKFRAFSSVSALALILSPALTGADAAERQIKVEGQHRSDAVMITNVTVGTVDVQCGLVASASALQPVIPFEANDDWLQNTTLYLLNHTDKTIVSGQIALWFPDTGAGSRTDPMRVYNLTLGRLPAVAAFAGSTGQPIPQPPSAQPMSFMPGQRLVVHLGDYIGGIRASIDNMAFSAVKRVIVQRNSFVFADGMRWTEDGYSTPDPTRPGKWVRAAPSFFPGDPSSGWPPVGGQP